MKKKGVTQVLGLVLAVILALIIIGVGYFVVYELSLDKSDCSNDAVLCPDGTYVSRDPKNNCIYRPCPSQINKTNLTEYG